MIPRAGEEAGRAMSAMTDRQAQPILPLVILFWIVIFLVLNVRGALVEDLTALQFLPRRIAISVFGALLCWGSALVLIRLRAKPFPQQAAAGVLLTVVSAALQSAFHLVVYRVVSPLPTATPITPTMLGEWTIFWFGYFLAWMGVFLGLAYHRDIQARERKFARMRDFAKEAQIAALRHQINPHFLFNTLNSISALMMERRHGDAERMLLNLSEFFRATLLTDHSGTVPLEREIAMQKLYLAIEAVRFSDRMSVVVDVPDDLAQARTPSLILQPLTENAVRHGVENSRGRTTIVLRARREADRLRLIVEDDARAARTASPGTGIGLGNVAARLAAHYGDEADFRAAPRDEGEGFRVELSIPLEIRG